MHKKYDHRTIESKWQEQWRERGLYDIGEHDPKKEKEYVLVEWPYPSGNLHIGHWYAFAVPDIYVRARRMQGKQVLFPMGFDAFGLPAENAAIKHAVNPREWTQENIAHMRTQLTSMGNAFSWDKTTSSTDPDYYKWTQWMFTEFMKHDVAYRGQGIVNWCPSCNTVLANEQVLADDTCERCGSAIEKREMDEWKMRITNYADRLLADLDDLDWPEHIKEAQRQWIGKSEGALLKFAVKGGGVEDEVEVFTTRPDTLFGATYLVLAPEHEFLKRHKDAISNWSEVAEYKEAAQKKNEQDRLDQTKEKTGIKLEGVTAINPGSNEEIPVYISDYVLLGYGTGAIMAVPAHDERDAAFAEKFNLPTKQVIAPWIVTTGKDAPRSEENIFRFRAATVILKHWSDENSYYVVNFRKGTKGLVGGHNEEGETIEETARHEVEEESGYTDIKDIKLLQEYQFGRGFKTRKNREEICEDCCFVVTLKSDSRVEITDEETKKGLWMTADEILHDPAFLNTHKDFFVRYLERKVFTGEGKLVNSGKFNDMNSNEAKRAITEAVGGEMTNTYRLRDWSVGRQRYWGVPIPIVYDPEGTPHPIPLEHLPWTLPDDVDFRPTGEPPLAKSKELAERTERIFGKGWTPEVETMDTFLDSSWYFLRYIDNQNDESASSLARQKEWMPVDVYFGGAEHTTMHLLYSRFWQKVLFDLGHVTKREPYTKRVNRGLILGPDGNKMSKSKGNVIDPDVQLKEVGADAVKMYLAFMGPYEGSNYPWDMGGIMGIRRFLERVYRLAEHVMETESDVVTTQLHKTIKKVTDDVTMYKFNTAISALMVLSNTIEEHGCTEETYKTFLRLMAPFAPHLAEELWERVGESFSIHTAAWPTADPEQLREDTMTLAVQINGKLRGTVLTSPNASEETVLDLVRADQKMAEKIKTAPIERVIYVPGKIINIIQ